MLARMRIKRISFASLVGLQAGVATLENSMAIFHTMYGIVRFLKKLKIELPYDPGIALLGIYLWDTGVLF